MTKKNTEPQVTHLTDESRFVISSADGVAHLDYVISGKQMVINHTFVPPVFRGKGYAAILADAAFAYVEESKFELKSECSYIESYLLRKNK